VQAVPPAHDTPYTAIDVAPDGVASVCTDQLLPSQRSTHPVPTSIAVHADAAEQDTRESAPGIGPETGCGVHAAPFHASDNGVSMPELST
jgi:hypothetical protein